MKFWQFELIVDQQSESKVKILSLVHNRTLKLEEGVLCVKLSADSKFIAVALLDSTVKIFFADSFKVPEKLKPSISLMKVCSFTCRCTGTKCPCTAWTFPATPG